MKAFLIVLVVFITFPLFSVHGQEMIDVIYKNNGDILKGLIIETVPNDYVRIELKDGSVFTVKYSEIAKITKEKTATTTEVENKNERGSGLMFTLLGGADLSEEPLPGVGFRFGGTPIKGLYAGATVVTHFGEDNSVTYYGAEIGVSYSQEAYIIQSYLGLGGVSSDDYDTAFYISPAVAIFFRITESFNIGGDFKYIYIPDTEKYVFPIYLCFQFAW